MNLYNDDLDDDDDDDEDGPVAPAAKTAAPKAIRRKKPKVAKKAIPFADFLLASFADPKHGKLAAKFVEKFIKKHPEVNFGQLQEFLKQFSEKVDGVTVNSSPAVRLSTWEPPA